MITQLTGKRMYSCIFIIQEDKPKLHELCLTLLT